MKRMFATIVGLAMLGPGGGLAGQSKSGSLQGVWQTVEVVVAGPTPRTITIPQPGPWLTIITAKHYSRTEDQSESPRPTLAAVGKATADELRATWGPFIGEAGTYDVSGDIVTMRPLISKNPAAMAAGAFIVYTYKIDGNTLWLTQQRNQNGPYPVRRRSKRCGSNSAGPRRRRHGPEIPPGRSVRRLTAAQIDQRRQWRERLSRRVSAPAEAFNRVTCRLTTVGPCRSAACR